MLFGVSLRPLFQPRTPMEWSLQSPEHYAIVTLFSSAPTPFPKCNLPYFYFLIRTYTFFRINAVPFIRACRLQPLSKDFSTASFSFLFLFYNTFLFLLLALCIESAFTSKCLLHSFIETNLS